MAKHAARRRRRSARRSDREWVGGCLAPPFFVTDRDEPYRPGLIAWVDVRDGLVVGQAIVGPEDREGALGRALRVALTRPLAGPPRRPDRIRVADASLAAEVRDALGDAIPIDIAPTPELDDLLDGLLESMRREDEADDASYFEQGRIPPEAVADLFASAEALYRVAPWTVATDDQVLRMDIPALGVEGACVSIIGNLRESLGLLVFPSLAGYEAFGRAADAGPPAAGPLDLGTDWLSLSFERGADLPSQMRREVTVHAWPVADANAYPQVGRHERDAACRPLVERDVKIVSACAAALTAFFVKHRGVFDVQEFEPICESWFDADDLEVCFTMPYEAFGWFDLDAAPQRPPSARIRVGRNDPCPCGSGRKYKKCHLAADTADRASETERLRDHDLDGELAHELSDYAMVRFGFEWRGFADDFGDSDHALQLAVPWSLYHYRVQGQSVLEWYLAERGRKLSSSERSWLAAQQAAWLSVWEVIDVDPGKSVTLRDLLTHEERFVREASGSQSIVVRDALLGRIVDQGGVSLLCGAHPRPLPPAAAAGVVRRARGRLRRKLAVPVERLRDEAFGRYLIRRWEEAVDELDRCAAIPPELRNTDGDPLLLTTDHFAFEPAERSAVERRLEAIEGAERDASEDAEDDSGPASAYVFLEPRNPMHASWQNTVIGRAVVSRARLRVESNSRERADALRARLEAGCGELLRHRAREHSDPLAPAVRSAAAATPAMSATPEVEQLLLEFKRHHYADWVDQALPALGGQTPRAAVRTARGRDAVDLLLKDMENRERRSSGQSAFDFGEIRRELRLE